MLLKAQRHLPRSLMDFQISHLYVKVEIHLIIIFFFCHLQGIYSLWSNCGQHSQGMECYPEEPRQAQALGPGKLPGVQKSQVQSLHLDQDHTLCDSTILWKDGAMPCQKNLQVLNDGRWTWATNVSSQPRKPTISFPASKEAWPTGWGKWSCLLPCSSETSPRILHADM